MFFAESTGLLPQDYVKLSHEKQLKKLCWIHLERRTLGGDWAKAVGGMV